MYKSNLMAGCRLLTSHMVSTTGFNQRPKENSSAGKVIFVKNCVPKDDM